MAFKCLRDHREYFSNSSREVAHSKVGTKPEGQSIEIESESVGLNDAFAAAVGPSPSPHQEGVRVTGKGIGLQFGNTLLA